MSLSSGCEEKSRSSDARDHRASSLSTGTPDAVSSDRLQDPTLLYHHPSNEVNTMLKIKTTQNECQTFGVQEDSSGLRLFPSESCIVGEFS